MNRRQILGAIAGAAAALSLAACGAGSTKEEAANTSIVFATQKNGVPFLAQERGEFEKRLKARGFGPVKWVEFSSGPPLIEALRAGAVDIGLVGDTPVVYAQASGTDLYYVATQSFPGLVGSGLVVPKTSKVQTFADLKGKKVAYTKGSSSEYAIASALGRVGLKLSDIQPVNLAPGDAQTALANGSIDAWLTWDPYFTLAQIRGGAREITLPPSDLRSVSLYIASGKFVRDRTDVLKATLDELRTEAQWGNANRDYYSERVANATRLPPAVLSGMLDRYKDFLFAVDPVTPADIATQQKVSDYLFDAKVVPVKVDAAKAAWSGWTPAK